MFLRVQLAPTEEHLQQITADIGRVPRGVQAVMATDRHGHPLAVQVASLIDDHPFPTLYWLTSRHLAKEISHLEAAGVIKQLEARLQDDPALMEAYRLSHQDYVTRRWAAMTPAEQQRIDALGYRDVFEKRGVGGIENWQQVRCLHTQYAHHLAGYNVIGELLDQEYGIAATLP
ncbi:DUF501 domain-containing protein [Marinospirillum sp. MEB164]|uniref:DUF501 domain-containing protein n=1 Tax=Marinospirillum alkalitolerans TaxID=3123374 RepID=A0ABW8PY00_9GAMM